ncbi:MAG: hypothetical protein ABSG91_07915 [Syntrophobacteraceae bacterium]|jgi:hypothetical protein
MARFIILSILILQLSLPLFSPGRATATMVKKTVQQTGASSKAGQPKGASSKAGQQTGASSTAGRIVNSPSSVQSKVINIIVDRIESGSIYSKDGRKFEIGGSTKVINNRTPSIRIRTAELVFENGILVTVNLK